MNCESCEKKNTALCCKAVKTSKKCCAGKKCSCHLETNHAIVSKDTTFHENNESIQEANAK